MKKAVLLDFDGVVLKSHAASSHVASRCSQYTKKFINVRNPIKTSEINMHLYKSHGHTLLGLQKLGFADATIHGFNSFVYDSLDYHTLFKGVRDTHNKDADAMYYFVDKMTQRDMHVMIFSNAPPKWCSTILDKLCPGLGDLECISTTSRYLKPQKQCYQETESLMRGKGFDKFFFIDDSMLNFQPVNGNGSWTKFLFSQEPQEHPIAFKDQFYMVSSLHQVLDAVDAISQDASRQEKEILAV